MHTPPCLLRLTPCLHADVTQMAQIMGRVHINKSELNLLSSVLDVPDWFWT
jgi:uncharacterized Rmd1/YagE family protein